MFRGGLFESGVLSRLVGCRGATKGEGASSNGTVNGSPSTTDAHTKYFEREGWDVREVAAAEIPEQSNQADGVAFCVTDTREPLNNEIKASHPIAVFAPAEADVEIPLGEHFDGGGGFLKTEDEAQGSELRGFGINGRPRGKGAKFTFNRGGLVRDVTLHGEQDGTGDWPAGLYATLIGQHETLTLRNYNARGGASRTGGVKSTHDSIGVLLDGRSNGLLRMEGCEVNNYPDNGLYASGPRKHNNAGRAIVEDCVFRDSDRDGVRVGNDSVVRRTDIINDTQNAGKDNFRGFWLRYARGVLIEDCTVKTFPGDDPGSAVRIDDNAGRVTIRDLDVELRGSNDAARGIEAYSPNRSVDDSLLTVKNTRFHGPGQPKQVVLVKEGRGTDFDGLDIDVPNAGRAVHHAVVVGEGAV